MNKKQALIYGIILIVLFFFVPKAIKYLRFNKSVGIVTQISTGTFHGLRDSTSFEYPNILFITEKKQEVYYRKDNEVLFVMPEVGDKMVESMRRVVVFPAPFGPSSEKTFPG